VLGSRPERPSGCTCEDGLLNGGLGADPGGGGGADGGGVGGGGGAFDGDDLCVPYALRAACMAIEFCNPWEDGLDGAVAGGGGGGVEREWVIEGAALGGGGGAEGCAGPDDDGGGGGGAGGCRADEDGFLEVTGGGGGLLPGTETDEDGLGAGLGGGLFKCATEVFEEPGNGSLD
jgi:hypothetical protein